MFSLDNHIAVVTGGAAGIGRGIATQLKNAGATVVIADIDDAARERTAAELGVHARPVDVTDRVSVRTCSPGLLKTSARWKSCAPTPACSPTVR